MERAAFKRRWLQTAESASADERAQAEIAYKDAIAAAEDLMTRSSELRERLNEVDREIDHVDSLLAAMHADLANSLDPGRLIAELSRAVGQERGSDISLRLIYARWWALGDQSRLGMWPNAGQELVGPVTDLLSVAIPSKFGIFDLEAYEEFLQQIVPLVAGIDGDGRSETRKLLAHTFETVVARSYERSRESGVWETPAEIADLMGRLACSPNSTVLDPTCGMARTLMTAAQRFPNCFLRGVEITQDIAVRAWMRLQLSGSDADISVGDAFDLIRADGKHDAVVMQPPWGVRLNDEQVARVNELIAEVDAPETYVRRDLPWLLLAFWALRPGGRAAVILPVGTLFDIHRRAHRYLLNRGAVEAIIALPEGGLFPHTRIGTALWLLRREFDPDPEAAKQILVVDAESIVTEPGAHVPILTPDGVDDLVNLVEKWRRSGEVSAPSHVAVSIAADSPELALGLDPRRFLAESPPNQASIPEPPNRLLRSVYIENFKSFEGRTRIPLAPLTVIFGANSAGKSTIIQSLLLLKQSLGERHLVTQGADTDVGAFGGVVHYRRPSPLDDAMSQPVHVLGLGIEYGTLNSWIPSDGVPNPKDLRTVEFRFADTAPTTGTLASTTIAFDSYSVGLRADHSSGQIRLDFTTAADIADGLAVRQDFLFPSRNRALTADGSSFGQRSRAGNALRNLGQRNTLQPHANREAPNEIRLEWNGLLPGMVIPLSRRALAGLSDFEVRIVNVYLEAVGQLVAGVSHEVRQLFKSLVYLGPLRSPPQRFYNRGSLSAHPGDGQHVAMYLFDHSNVVKKVNDWLQVLEVPYTVDVVPVRAKGAGALVGDLVALSLTDTRSGAVVTPADVGFGVSQMLPIVVELLARRESVVCIEQPETHLHPRLQTRLADLLIESSRNDDLANQVIVETHSEHLMLRLQRRIREGGIDAEDVCILYVDQTPDGVATVSQLRINDDGEFLDDWPHGFFDERLDELFGSQ